MNVLLTPSLSHGPLTTCGAHLRFLSPVLKIALGLIRASVESSAILIWHIFVEKTAENSRFSG
tara:strand:- start:212 stop:400 length:189 start_codon:yes stop_codon:yes gene_type:complete